MSFTLALCPNLSIDKLFCRGCCISNGKDKKDGVLYSDPTHSIMIMLSDGLQIDQYAPMEDLKTTDFLVVIRDKEHDLTFASVQGTHAFQAERLTEEKMVGFKLKDCLPAYVFRFLAPLFDKTLAEGAYFALVIQWNQRVLLLRTIPITDHQKRIIAAHAILSPFTSEFQAPPSPQAMMERISMAKELVDQKAALNLPKVWC